MKKHFGLIFALFGNLADFITFGLFLPAIKQCGVDALEFMPLTKLFFKTGSIFSFGCYKILTGSAIILGIYVVLSRLEKTHPKWKKSTQRVVFILGTIFWLIAIYQFYLYLHI